MVLDTSAFAISNMDQREYHFIVKILVDTFY
jgi:hypothetical protein